MYISRVKFFLQLTIFSLKMSRVWYSKQEYHWYECDSRNKSFFLFHSQSISYYLMKLFFEHSADNSETQILHCFVGEELFVVFFWISKLFTLKSKMNTFWVCINNERIFCFVCFMLEPRFFVCCVKWVVFLLLFNDNHNIHFSFLE